MRRHHWISLALVVLSIDSIASAISAADQEVTSQAKAESEAFVKAFNQHNAKAVGTLCTETADFAFLQGSSLETMQFGLVSGRDELAATIEVFFQMFPSCKLAHTVRRARLVTPDCMVSDEDFEITGLPADSGPIEGQFIVIRVRTGGAWRIAAERNVSKVPAPKRAAFPSK
jgi:hypothetical protein